MDQPVRLFENCFTKTHGLHMPNEKDAIGWKDLTIKIRSKRNMFMEWYLEH